MSWWNATASEFSKNPFQIFWTQLVRYYSNFQNFYIVLYICFLSEFRTLIGWSSLLSLTTPTAAFQRSRRFWAKFFPRPFLVFVLCSQTHPGYVWLSSHIQGSRLWILHVSDVCSLIMACMACDRWIPFFQWHKFHMLSWPDTGNSFSGMLLYEELQPAWALSSCVSSPSPTKHQWQCRAQTTTLTCK